LAEDADTEARLVFRGTSDDCQRKKLDYPAGNFKRVMAAAHTFDDDQSLPSSPV
jgi:hypothetical protein